ncbi:unnamed protein product [Trifolium pratense]|uniref:Uncharacterized protein n=1 Tax=Trifolium pratense TaxID=57577 RepID=A0ACB0IUD4_TRIPR|nr:unnamed protein product [Trifolium pratense]
MVRLHDGFASGGIDQKQSRSETLQAVAARNKWRDTLVKFPMIGDKVPAYICLTVYCVDIRQAAWFSAVPWVVMAIMNYLAGFWSVRRVALLSEPKCPFEAIQIINLPKDLDKYTTYRYGPNTCKLHRLPVPRPGQVLGLVGTIGIGKSTALKVLAGKLKPNLGRFTNPPDWQEILTYFRGSELQSYFTRILEDDLKVFNDPTALTEEEYDLRDR